MTEYAIALGTFDGMHKGHISVIKAARESGYPCVAVTFSIPPKSLIEANSPRLLMTDEGKKRSLGELGVEKYDCLDFDKVRNMAPVEFLDFICQKHNAKMISCGFNYRFGKEGKGDSEAIKEFCLKNGIECKITSPVTEEGNIISSTVIREMLKNGEVKAANKLLSEPFSFVSEVIQGDKRGRTIGFPTVNQKYPEELVRLRFGVYKTKIEYNGKEYFGITDIGIRPTYKLDFIISETYIKDFSGDLYGEELRITPLEFLRDEVKFISLEELKKQIEIDLNS